MAQIRGFAFSQGLSKIINRATATPLFIADADAAADRALGMQDAEAATRARLDAGEKLPDISPTNNLPDFRPLRAKLPAKQTIVSGPKDEDNATQRIWITQASERREKSVEFVQIVHVFHVAVTETDS